MFARPPVAAVFCVPPPVSDGVFVPPLSVVLVGAGVALSDGVSVGVAVGDEVGDGLGLDDGLGDGLGLDDGLGLGDDEEAPVL